MGFQFLCGRDLLTRSFETIHPFLDGNGRMGRLLIALLLAEKGVLTHPLLYISLFLREHRDEYFELLSQLRHTGDWEAWLAFFLEGVRWTAVDAVETANRLSRLFEEDRARIEREAGRTGQLRPARFSMSCEKGSSLMCRRGEIRHRTVISDGVRCDGLPCWHGA